jgi:hypothetical protein
MNLDVYNMARQIDCDRRDHHLRTAIIEQPGFETAHRHWFVVGLGRAFNRLGDFLQGIPAPAAPDLSPEPTTG